MLSFNSFSIPAGEKHSSLLDTHAHTELSHGFLHTRQVKRLASGEQNAEEILEIETSSPKNEDEYAVTSDAELDAKSRDKPKDRKQCQYDLLYRI